MTNLKQRSTSKRTTPLQRASKKVKVVSKDVKDELILLLEKGLKKGEKGLSYLEKGIHRLMSKQAKKAAAVKQKVQSPMKKKSRAVTQGLKKRKTAADKKKR